MILLATRTTVLMQADLLHKHKRVGDTPIQMQQEKLYAPVGSTDECGLLGIKVRNVFLQMERKLIQAPWIARKIKHQLQHIRLCEARRMIYHVCLPIGVVRRLHKE